MVVLLVVFVFGAIIVFKLWKRMKKNAKDTKTCSDEEVKNFVHGYEAADPKDPHAPIYCRPFNFKYEVRPKQIQLGTSKMY